MYWSSMAGEGSLVSVGGGEVAQGSLEVNESASMVVRSVSGLVGGSVVGGGGVGASLPYQVLGLGIKCWCCLLDGDVDWLVLSDLQAGAVFPDGVASEAGRRWDVYRAVLVWGLT